MESGAVAHTCNYSYSREAEIGRMAVWYQSEQKDSMTLPCLNNKLGMA
jgi:hypothetical protein